MKPGLHIRYDKPLDKFVLVVPAAGRAFVLQPEEAIDLRIDLRRELWKRAEELGEHGR